jgi:hypothetical protein
MLLAQALLIFATRLIGTQAHDQTVMENTVAAIAAETSDLSEAETLIKIARFESGGFRKDVASCKVMGDRNQAMGLFQVHPTSKEEMRKSCSKDYREQVQVALVHVRDSVEICRMHGYRGAALLTIYTNGKCTGKQLNAARLRWGSFGANRGHPTSL